MRIFHRLLSSGLPITWTTLHLAWNGQIEIPMSISHLISSEQLLDYAMGQIGYGPPQQEALTAELAFADERDTWTIRRCLEGLASSAPKDLRYAVRVWRWVLLSEIVAELERQTENAPDKNAPIYGVWTDDFRSGVYCALRDFWGRFEFPSQGFAVAKEWTKDAWLQDIPSTLRLIEEHRRWLVQEASVLRDYGRHEG